MPQNILQIIQTLGVIGFLLAAIYLFVMPILVSYKNFDKLLGTKEGVSFRYRYHNWAVLCLFGAVEVFMPGLFWLVLLLLGFGVTWWEYTIEMQNITKYYKD